MKRQQLFSSLALASITTVLASQPTRADTAPVTAVKLNPTASGIEVILETPSSNTAQVFTSTEGENFVANIVNAQLRFPKGNTFRASNPTKGIGSVTVTSLDANSIRVTVTGKANAPTGQMAQSDKGLVFSLKTNSQAELTPALSRLIKNQQQVELTKVGQQAQNTGLPVEGKKNSQTAQPAPAPRKLAQSVPLPNPTSPTQPAPTGSDVRTQLTPAPSYLNPNPNPLQFPTKPEEVRILGAQPITLQQAIDLALRNNRELEVERLTLRGSRAALRQQQAAEFPTLGLGIGITNSASNVFSDEENAGAGIVPGGTGTTGTVGTGGTGTGTGTGGIVTGGTGTGGIVTGGTGTGGTGTTGTGGTGTGGTGTGGTGTGTTGTGTGTTGTGTGTTGTGTGTTDTEIGAAQVVTPGTGTGGTGTGGTGTGGTDTTGGGTTDTTGGSAAALQGSSGGSSTALSGSLQLSYDLYTAGLRRANIRAAEEQVNFDQLDLERFREELRLNVATDYYNLQGADEQVRINQSAVTNAAASLRDAQALEQAGVGTRFDVLQAQVQLANSTQLLTNALSQQQINRRQLALRLSVPQSVIVTTADSVEIAGLWNLPVEETIVLAFQNRAELPQQLAQRSISVQNRRAALASLGPQVSLSAAYTLNDGFNDDQSFTDNYSIGANVSLSLFDGGSARAQADQAEANIAIAEAGFAQQRDLIRQAVEQAFSQLQANLENVQTASVALEQAREALRLARLRFQAGVGTQTDVITAEDDLTIAEGNRVTAILDYNRALASLQRAVSSGRPR